MGHDLLGIDDDVLGWAGGGHSTGGRYHSTIGQAVKEAASAAADAAAAAAMQCYQPGTVQRFPARPGMPVDAGGYATMQPPWRHGQYAPGVMQPREHITPLPLIPSTNNGIFTSAITSINYSARPQKPFRGERLIALVFRSGASAAGVVPVSQNIFVGTDLQQAQQGNIPVDIWAAQAFGVRLYMTAAQPGIDINIPLSLIGALTAPDTINVQLTILGSFLMP